MISVNGEPSALAPGETVVALLALMGLEAQTRGVAVAVDGEVVPRVQWSTFAVADGARVEVLRAMQGG